VVVAVVCFERRGIVQRKEVGSKNENKKRLLKIKILLFTKLNRYWRVSPRRKTCIATNPNNIYLGTHTNSKI
jgi:hypothetical protein